MNILANIPINVFWFLLCAWHNILQTMNPFQIDQHKIFTAEANSRHATRSVFSCTNSKAHSQVKIRIANITWIPRWGELLDDFSFHIIKKLIDCSCKSLSKTKNLWSAEAQYPHLCSKSKKIKGPRISLFPILAIENAVVFLATLSPTCNSIPLVIIYLKRWTNDAKEHHCTSRLY